MVTIMLPSSNFSSTQAVSMLNTQDKKLHFVVLLRFSMFSLCQPTCSSLPFLRIGWCQLEAKASFTDFIGLAAVFVIVDRRRHSDGYSSAKAASLFCERRVVGVDFNHIVCIGEKRYWFGFLLLDKTCFHKIPPFFHKFFANSTPVKNGQFPDKGSVQTILASFETLPLDKNAIFAALHGFSGYRPDCGFYCGAD